jgi:hypothetical protein
MKASTFPDSAWLYSTGRTTQNPRKNIFKKTYKRETIQI